MNFKYLTLPNALSFAAFSCGAVGLARTFVTIPLAVIFAALVLGLVFLYLDGWVAWRFNLTSLVGRAMQPFVHSSVALGAITPLAKLGYVPLWLSIVLMVVFVGLAIINAMWNHLKLSRKLLFLRQIRNWLYLPLATILAVVATSCIAVILFGHPFLVVMTTAMLSLAATATKREQIHGWFTGT